MRAILITALAVGAIAAPQQHGAKKYKRDVQVVVETETDTVYVTDIVTVTATDSYVSPSVAPADISSSSASYAATPAPINHAVNPPSYSSPPVLSTTSYPGPTVVSSATSIAGTSNAYSSPSSSPVQSSSSSSAPVTSSSSVVFTSIIPVTSIPPVVSTSSVVSSPPASSTSEPSTSSSTAAQSGWTAGIPQPTDYASLVVAHHNLHRRNHSATDIVWDNNLANTASLIAGNCIYAHNTSANKDQIGGYGQNIAAGIAANNISVIITELFYNGEENWYSDYFGESQPDMTYFDNWGHFSQIVWQATTKVGCATNYCPKGLANVAPNVPPYVTICNYQSPGNVEGEYTQVGSPLGYPTVHWDFFGTNIVS